MITIKEEKTQKVVGDTSLFIQFNYKPELVAICKNCDGGNYSKKTKTWEVPLTYLAELIDNFCEYDEIKLELKKDSKAVPPAFITIPKLGKTTLFDYQEDGVRFCLDKKKCLLLDVPGLGKSIQILNTAEILKSKGLIKHCLIICGLNTLKWNWKNEISKHTYSDSVILGERLNRKGNTIIGSVQQRLEHLKKPIDEFYVITNIETLRNTDIAKEIRSGINQFDMIVFDEIHKCKDSNSQASKNLLKLNTAPYRIGLTGTLLLNNPLDAYVGLNWIGAERSTKSNFKYYYTKFGGPFNNEFLGYKNINVLKDTLNKYALRRQKDMLNLPEKTIINEYVDMDDAQSKFYDEVKRGIRDNIDKVKLSTANLLSMVARLRQATACPSILTTNKINSAKQERCIDLVEQITSGQEKVVIFSTFKDTANELYDQLKEYNPVLCTGDIKDSIIEQNKEKFQNDPNYKVFIATWQKCGTGLTLTAANNVIFIDTPWTMADYEQAQDRCHRIGTNKNVTIYNLITKDTIDEKVLQIVEDKGMLSDYIIDDTLPEKALDNLKKYIKDI